MKFIKFLCVVLAGATVMLLLLLWVAQFFTRDYDTQPLIWIERMTEPEQEREDRSFGEWQK
ncbi:MAG: hypothetical protein WC997_06615 [Porticoccaceae bacterium]